MKELAAYTLLVLGGNASPSADAVSAVITAGGGEADADKLATLISDLEGKNFEELFTTGRESLKNVSLGGGGGSSAGNGGNSSSNDNASAPAAAPVEEEVEEIAGGTDMFGGGGDDY